MHTTRTLWVRRFVACVASTLVTALLARGIAAATRTSISEGVFVGAMVMVPLVAGCLIWMRSVTAQLLARGAWWASLLFGTLGAAAGTRDGRHLGGEIALAAALALLVVGTSGLEEEGGRFRPTAFRGTLLLALVLSMADTGSLFFFGLGNALFEGRPWMLLLVAPMVAGVIGLLRLRTWGLLLGLLCNLALAILALTRALDMPAALRALYVGTATLQLLVPLPMLISLARGRVPAANEWRRAKRAASTVAIVALAGLSTWAAFVHTGGQIVNFE